MKDMPHIWQQADSDKSFVFALNEKLTNEFCFMVQGCKQDRAEEIATLACAAPQLLEALENLSSAYGMLCHQIDENPESNKYYMAAIAAIAAARGE